MTERGLEFRITDDDGDDVTQAVIDFAVTIGLERVVPGRYSVLLLLELFGGFRARRLNPARVMREIEALEGRRRISNLKPAAKFKRTPLRGLWHKHYLRDGMSTMAVNSRRGIEKYGLPWLEKLVADAETFGTQKFLTEEDTAWLADDAVTQNWKRLVMDSSLTGEWLVFAKYQEANYYLCLGRHKDDQDLMRHRIEEICFKEFPFLADTLN